MQAQLFNHFEPGFAHQFRTRVEVVVNAVTKAHQLDAQVLLVDLLDAGRDVLDITDFLKHVQEHSVSPAVGSAPY